MVVALWNYAEPNTNGAPKTFHIAVKAGRTRHYQMQFVDPDHGSALKAWQTMGAPAFPTKTQIQQLIKASALSPPQQHSLNDPVTLAPQSLAVLLIQ